MYRVRVTPFASGCTPSFPQESGCQHPTCILTAGHRTHLPALAARRPRGGRIVVLMKASLPLRWFDLCLIPQHDDPPQRNNVIATRGVLHEVRPSERHDPVTGLILLGGSSRHHDWDTDTITMQVRQVVTAQPDIHFVIGDSPRTPPPDTLQRRPACIRSNTSGRTVADYDGYIKGFDNLLRLSRFFGTLHLSVPTGP